MSNTEKPIRVAVAERNMLTRKGLCSLTEHQSSTEIYFDAGNTRQLLELLARRQPDVLLLDAGLPTQPLPEVVAAINTQFPEVRILLICEPHEQSLAVQLLEYEVYGIISRDAGPDELFEAIRTASNAKCYGTDMIKNLLVKQYQSRLGKKIHHLPTQFTEKEINILNMMIQDMSTEEIADACFLSTRSIEVIRGKMKKKAGVKTLPALIHYAWQQNIISNNKAGGMSRVS